MGGITQCPGSAVPPQALPEARHSLHLLGILCVLMAFASISTDLYLPAMPMMEHALHSRTAMIEWTITGYLIGFSAGQMLWGPIADRYGRRVPVALGIALFVVGAAGCALAPSAAVLIAWRVVQAFGACAGVVIGRAMVRDLYAGQRGAQMLSTLMVVMGVAPLIAPVLGGQILRLAGWRAIFWTLAGVGLLTLIALFTLPETLPRERRNHEPLVNALRYYAVLLREPVVMGYALVGGCFYMGIFASIAGSSFAYIAYHHVSPQWFGVIFSSGIIGIMAVNLTNARLVMRLGGLRLMRIGSVVAASAGAVVALDASFDWGGIMGLAVPIFIYVSAMGFIVANSISGAMHHYPHRAGAVSALVGAVHYGGGLLGSAVVGALANGTPAPMGWMMAAGGVGGLVCTRFIRAAPPIA